MDYKPSLFGRILLIAEKGALVLIFLATVVAMVLAVKTMVEAQTVTLGDLLLLFLFLEILSMIAVFHKLDKVPVRYPIYIAITALTRYLTLDLKGLDLWTVLIIGITILLLALAVLVLKFGLSKDS